MSEHGDYGAALEHAKWRYSTHGLSASNRAYEYGLPVVKNAFMVAGGGLFFIPAMVGLSADVKLTYAFYSGACFAAGVLLALIGNYLIHVNWMLHEKAWKQIYDIERQDIRKAYSCSFDADPKERVDLIEANVRTSHWITSTFWLPHILVVLFVISLVAGALNLYWSFDFFPVASESKADS